MKTLSALGFLLFTLTLPAIGQDLSAGLLLHYPLDGNALDASGNNRHGQIAGTVAAMDRFGNTSGALQFGIGTSLIWPQNDELKPPLPLSLSCWVYCDDFPNLGRAIITNDFVENRYYGVILSYNFNRQVVINIGDGGAPNPDSRRSKTGNTILETGRWYHIVAIVRGLTDMDIYINGCNDGGIYSGTGDSMVYSFPGPGVLGLVDDDVSSLSPFLYHPGRIDDFRFWNRALSAIEIAELYGQFYPASANIFEENELQLCQGDSITLDASLENGLEYYWSDGISEALRIITTSGTFKVTVVDDDGCTFTDTIQITEVANSVISLNLEDDLLLCQGEIASLFPTEQVDNLLWNNGSSALSIDISSPGSYWLTGLVNNCPAISDTIQVAFRTCQSCNLYFPNAFSPNNDGINDEFGAFYDPEMCSIASYRLQIFDRWGGLVFESRDPLSPWLGKRKGKPAGSGVYTYLVVYEIAGGGQSEYVLGSFSLVR